MKGLLNLLKLPFQPLTLGTEHLHLKTFCVDIVKLPAQQIL